MTVDYHKLKSGSDIRGIAIGDGTILSKEVVRNFGAAFALFLAQRNNTSIESVSVAIGRDSRLSGPELIQAACEGIASTGAKAYDCAMCTTPSMYMAIVEPGFSPTGSIMITASHHPWNINGMKFFTIDGGLGHDELDRVTALAEKQTSQPVTRQNAIEEYPYIPLYQKHLETLIQSGIPGASKQPLQGLHVVVDAGQRRGRILCGYA